MVGKQTGDYKTILMYFVILCVCVYVVNFEETKNFKYC